MKRTSCCTSRQRETCSMLWMLLLCCIYNSSTAFTVPIITTTTRPTRRMPTRRARTVDASSKEYCHRDKVRRARSYVSMGSATNSQESEQQDAASFTTINATATTRYNWTRPSLEIALPALIGMMTDPLLSLMDTAFVGRVGSTELAALGACTSIFHLAFNAFRATTTATTSLVATSLVSEQQQQEENDMITKENNNKTTATTNEKAKQVTQISLGLGLTLGTMVLILLRFVAGPWCLRCMGVFPEKDINLFRAAWVYLKTRSWAAPFVLWIVVAEGAFRGYGDTKIPLLASMVAAVLNLVLDPLFMFGFGWQVMGAAAATATAQVGAACVYGVFLKRRQMLPPRQNEWLQKLKKQRFRTNESMHTTKNKLTMSPRAITLWCKRKLSFSQDTWTVIRTILQANLAMMAKQGSLLLAWAYATARATRLGTFHVAAHQVGLSFWLVFALWLDGAAVSAQVLMSRALRSSKKRVKSLTWYMIRLATVQGLASTLLIFALGTTMVPTLFTKNASIRILLRRLMPHLAWQQLLISWTLVTEGLAVGGNQFNILAVGTCLSTVLAMHQLHQATSVTTIWSRGIVTLFVGRLVTALVGTARVNGVFAEHKKQSTA